MATKRTIDINPDFASKSRELIFKAFIFSLAAVFIVRLGYLQIIKGSDFKRESTAQAIKEETVDPFRGNIYDRNGVLLVHNEPSFTVTITFNDYRRNPATHELLASIMGMDTSSLSDYFVRFNSESKFRPTKVFKDLDFNKLALIEEYSEYLPGVDIVTESKRLFNERIRMSHLIGYTREINKTELDKIIDRVRKEVEKSKTPVAGKDFEDLVYYRNGDIIGKTGIEKTYEKSLRGTKGIKYVAVNHTGMKIARFDDGRKDDPVHNGYDMNLSIDVRLQELAEDRMKDRRGAVIAIDPRNGEILAFVSAPDYDLKSFSGRVTKEVYQSLTFDESKPLFNRAVMSKYPPGSTWKMLVAIGALQDKILDPNSTIACGGSFQYGGRSYGCHGAHGAVNVVKAIQASCNVFFYKLGLKLGLARMNYYAHLFGFGEKTNIDLPDESKGFFPSPEWVTKKFGQGAINGRLVNYGIGQGEIGVTPIQMAVYASALANKGFIVQPHTVKSVYNPATGMFEDLEFKTRELPIDKRVLDIVRKGMFDVVNTPGGTGAIAKVPGYAVSGKTGTAQNPHGKDHSWFISFAPFDNPQIAVVAIVENAGFGSAVAAPICRDVIEAFFYPDKNKRPSTAHALPDDATSED